MRNKAGKIVSVIKSKKTKLHRKMKLWKEVEQKVKEENNLPAFYTIKKDTFFYKEIKERFDKKLKGEF